LVVGGYPGSLGGTQLTKRRGRDESQWRMPLRADHVRSRSRPRTERDLSLHRLSGSNWHSVPSFASNSRWNLPPPFRNAKRLPQDYGRQRRQAEARLLSELRLAGVRQCGRRQPTHQNVTRGWSGATGATGAKAPDMVPVCPLVVAGHQFIARRLQAVAHGVCAKSAT